MVCEVAMCRSETPYPIQIQFCRVVDITDVIAYANFGEDRLRGLGVVGRQSLPFSVDFDRRPYNTLALPCNCDGDNAYPVILQLKDCSSM